MSSPQGTSVSPHGSASAVSATTEHVAVGSTESPKPTHALETNDGAPDSPSRAVKKRRLDSPIGASEESTLDSAAYSADVLEQQIQQAAAQSSTPNPFESTDLNDKKYGNQDVQDPNSAGSMPPSQDAIGNTAPPADPTSVAEVLSNISSIVGNTGRLGEQQHVLNRQLHELGKPSNFIFPKANAHLQIQSLPILDNLATQILSLLARSTYQELTAIVSEPSSEDGQAYSTMRSLFDHTKRVYTTTAPFLSAPELGFTEPAQLETIRKANMASFVSSIFGSQEVGFPALNENFLSIFVPEGGRLLKMQGALFLELKTQAFIAAMNSKDRSNSDLLYHLFPDDLGLKLLARRPGTRHLAPTETDFVKRAWSRRDILLAEADTPDARTKLIERYRWEDFLRDLSTYISKNFESIGGIEPKKFAKVRPSPTTTEETPEFQSAPLETQFPVAPPNPPEPQLERPGREDLVARAARAAQIALQGRGFRGKSSAATPQKPQQPSHQPQQQQQSQQQPQQPQPYQQQQQQQYQPQHQQYAQSPTPPPATSAQPPLNTPQTQVYQYHNTTAPSPPPQPPQPSQVTFRHQPPLQFQQYNPNAAMASRANAAAANYGYMPGVPHYSQSQPTQILYERARLATTAKSSPSSRRAGLPSQRRPWTTEEENALMAGLDRVKGPHWSQILAMFGPGGTISEALKDRNQVQLKDKARNLKLFFLKSGIEVPYYLKFVTGELKTRAPAQAAKQEARERERQQGEDDKAHVEGIEGMMALAGAHANAGQGTHPGTPSYSPTPPPMGMGMPMATPPAQTQPQPQAQIQPQHPEHQQHQQYVEQTTEQVLIQRLTQEDCKPEGITLDNQQQTTVDPALQQQPQQ